MPIKIQGDLPAKEILERMAILKLNLKWRNKK